MVRKTVLTTLVGVVVGLSGCSSDAPVKSTPAPTPQDSGAASKANPRGKTVGPRGIPAPVK